MSEPLLTEIARVLAYPKITRRLKWDAQRIERFVSLLRFRTTLADSGASSAAVPRDSGDDFLLATLLTSQADWLVSGDQDLLDLADRYPVLSPAEFAERFFQDLSTYSAVFLRAARRAKLERMRATPGRRPRRYQWRTRPVSICTKSDAG